MTASPQQDQLGAPPLASSPSLLSADPAGQQADGIGAEEQGYATDLNLDQIITSVAGERDEHELITALLYRRLHDADTARYRQEVFRDLEDPRLLEAFKRFSDQLTEVRRHQSQLEQMQYEYQKEGWLLDAASIYCEALQSLTAYLASVLVRSRALQAFRDYLAGYVASDAFITLAGDTRDRKDALARIRYLTRIHGGRVEVSRYDGEADYSAEVLDAFERFKQGAVKDYTIRYRTRPGMNHVAAQITELAAKLFPEEFTALHEYCRIHAGFLDEGVRRAHRELQFFLAYLAYLKPLKDAGLKFCYPDVSVTSKNIHAEDTFDLALARKLVFKGTPVVTNEFRLDGTERIIVVTGPNQGGKTTFARTFGQLHHLAAVGCPVPGRTARLFLADHLFTHFEREENLAAMSGKLEDDLTRIGAILQSATSDSIVILNEIFTSTTVQDARFLGTKLLTRVMQLDALAVYVTFVDELASLGEQVVSMMSTIVPGDPADRTYKVVRKPADGLAYALAIADKYGLTYQQLHDRLMP